MKKKKDVFFDEASCMSFDEALEVLDIVDFKNDIFNSNSHGELFHLMDYIALAMFFKEYKLENGDCPIVFREWFLKVVEYAKETEERPQSVYQHMGTLFEKAIEKVLQKIGDENE